MSLLNPVILIKIISQGQEFTIKDLQISCAIRKTEKRDSNTCVITIRNLSLHTKNSIDNNNSTVIVEAGYLDGPGAQVIFKGDISEVSYSILKPNTFTRIEVKDGFKAIKNKRTTLSYESGVNLNTILKEATKALGLPVKNVPTLTGKENKVYNQGYSFGGIVSHLLDDLTKDSDLVWSVQNSELKVYKENSSDNSSIISLNKRSGMIDSPEEIKIQRGKKSVSVGGYKVHSLLQPLIEPGGRVEITAKNVPRGIFKVISVNHTLDNHRGLQTFTEVIQ